MPAIAISQHHDQKESCPGMVGQEGAVLVQDEDEAEHGEGGEDEEEEVPEQVGRPEGGRVKARHDLNLLCTCRPLADWGVFILLVFLVNDDEMYLKGKMRKEETSMASPKGRVMPKA